MSTKRENGNGIDRHINLTEEQIREINEYVKAAKKYPAIEAIYLITWENGGKIYFTLETVISPYGDYYESLKKSGVEVSDFAEREAKEFHQEYFKRFQANDPGFDFRRNGREFYNFYWIGGSDSERSTRTLAESVLIYDRCASLDKGMFPGVTSLTEVQAAAREYFCVHNIMKPDNIIQIIFPENENEYAISLENIKGLRLGYEEVNNNINELVSRRAELEVKKENGTISSDEESELSGIQKKIEREQNRRGNILEEVFVKLSYKRNDNWCNGFHLFRRTNNALICDCCGLTFTAREGIGLEELDFATECFKRYNRLLSEVKESEVPFLQVQIEREKFFEDTSVVTFEDLKKGKEEKESQDPFEEYDQAEGLKKHVLEKQLAFARTQDSWGNQSCWLSANQREELEHEINRGLYMLKGKSDPLSNFMREEYWTAYYEILILSGKDIRTLFQGIDTKEKKIAFAKAYYNVSNVRFRAASNYLYTELNWPFEPSEELHHEVISDAIWQKANELQYLTADPEINKLVLRLKSQNKDDKELSSR